MKKKKTIVIFGSGHMEENFSEYHRSVILGRLLAEHRYVVCTGGYGGIMEAAPRGARSISGSTLGIITRELSMHANRWMEKVKIEKSWRDRLFRLVDVADAFVVMDGGTGTLTEFFLVWEMNNKRLMKKPVIIHGSYMIRLVKRLRRQRLVLFHPSLRYAHTPQQVLAQLSEVFEESDAS